MKKYFLLAVMALFFSAAFAQTEVRYLTTQEFKTLIFDYSKNGTWQYNGSKPCIIDFYATWCGPCRRLAPVMEELAEEYCDQVIFYKVDTDKEKELAYYFQITSIPTILFVPVKGQPQIAQGALPKETLKQAIDDVLLKKK